MSSKQGIEYQIIRSKRKTLSLEVRGGSLLVRAPLRVTNMEIELFVSRHRGWIDKQLEKALQRQSELAVAGKLTADDIRRLADEAKRLIPERVRRYAPIVGVTYGRITIRSQRTKWGSCSGKGNLNFNCLLMLTPPEVIDSVVVHELCHLKEMNHSEQFYAEVLRVMPDYRKWDRWLKDNGALLLMRLPERNALT